CMDSRLYTLNAETQIPRFRASASIRLLLISISVTFQFSHNFCQCSSITDIPREDNIWHHRKLAFIACHPNGYAWRNLAHYFGFFYSQCLCSNIGGGDAPFAIMYPG